MAGLSGNIITTDNNGYVHKMAYGGDAIRLYNGIQKQKAFKGNTLDAVQLKTPQIHWEKFGVDNSYTAKMEGIVRFHHPLQCNNLLWIALAKEYVDANLYNGNNHFPVTMPSDEVWRRLDIKIHAIMRRYDRYSTEEVGIYQTIKEAYDLFSVAFATKLKPLPIGNYHGDFTTCNMLCVEDAVYLIDFLDCVIPSPVVDVAKIRQDTAHGYADLFGGVHEATRQEADAIWVSLWEYETWWPYVPIFTLWHLLRILPYAEKSDLVKTWLLEKIPEATKELRGTF